MEDQAAANARIPLLMQLPAVVKFLSCEPLLGPVDLTYIEVDKLSAVNSLNGVGDIFYHRNDTSAIDWVIVGGESGNKTGKWLYREMHMQWLHGIITQCYKFGVPLFIKQMGTYLADIMKLKDRHGGDLYEWDTAYQIRQFPKKYQP